jgi:transaldolase
MRPPELRTRIFLDSGDPAETRDALDMLGFLDGQTTNPTLVAKNPYARERLEKDEKFTEQEIYAFYRKVVEEISGLIPDGSVSIEVHAEAATTADQMFVQGKEMSGWIPNAHIKYPTTAAGLEAASRSIEAGMRVNMTLCFTQEQAAAVYAATAGAAKGDVFVSPFVGRLDDIGRNGMDLIANVTRMYREGDGHVEVLAASVRTLEQFMQSLALEADIITAPFSVLEGWAKAAKPLPGKGFTYDAGTLQSIPYHGLDLSQPWQQFDIAHELTDKGIERFSADWQALITSV